MRKLQGKDMFTVAKIIKKADIKEKLASVIDTKEKDATKLGIKMFMTVVEGCANEGVDKEIFDFLDDVLEVQNTVNMDIFELVELVKHTQKRMI